MIRFVTKAAGWLIKGYRQRDPATGIKVEGPALTSRTLWGIILGTLGLAIKYALAPAVAGDTAAIDWSSVGTFVLTLATGLTGLGLIGKGHVLGIRADRLIRILMIVVADLTKVDLATIPQPMPPRPVAPTPSSAPAPELTPTGARLAAVLQQKTAREAAETALRHKPPQSP